MSNDHMRWRPDQEMETDRPVSIYGHDPGRDAVAPMARARMEGLGSEGTAEDALEWLEEEMDRLLRRPSHPVATIVPIPPERRPGPRGYQAETAWVDETQYRPERPRIAEVMVRIRTTDGLERVVRIEQPEEVRLDTEMEELDITSFMDPFPRYVPSRIMELIMRVRAPRSCSEETRRWVPPERPTIL